MIFIEPLDENNNIQISAELLREIQRLVGVYWLQIDNGSITGTIPVELGNLQNLEILDLNTNLLTGVVPLSLSRISELNVLNLGNNTIKKLQHGTEIIGDYEDQEEITELFNEILGQTHALKSLYKIENP
tara:strand:+ start:4207 stop:4596 length:390 start_codon:yes stop_codon:yes gene_type:complete